jgi:hypothetical protein
MPADEPTTEGVIAAMRRHDFGGHRLRDVAHATGRESDLLQGFKRIVVAAVGPIVASELESFGVQVSIMPSGGTFFMKPLVRELAAALTKDGKAGAA